MMQIFSTEQEDIKAAAKIIADGGLLAFPTETVYGLGANACDSDALARLYAAKGRPRFNPLIVHAASIEALEAHVAFSEDAKTLADRFWPGPLTMVLPRLEDTRLSPLVSAGLPSAAVRIPASETARKLLSLLKDPVAAPSANRSGQLSPTMPAHVLSELHDKIHGLIEAGSCAIGVESTIISLTEETPVLLRAGGLARSALEEALGKEIASPHQNMDGVESNTEARPAPGLLQSHYAPRALVRLNAKAAQEGETLLGFGEVSGASLNLSLNGDLLEAASNLFAMLHELDALGVGAIAVSPIPENGLGEAINDRLRRAAAPRP